MEKRKILVVDDDDYMRESIAESLRRKGYDIEAVSDGSAALDLFGRDTFDLVVSDMRMAGMSGMQLLEKIKQLDPDATFLMVTAYGDIGSAVEAVKKGAYEFLQKTPAMLEELELNVKRIMEFRQLVNENKNLKSVLTKQWNYIGSCKAIEDIRQLVKTVAESRSTVLITGESGTGKELVARSIHYQSPRHNKPFVKINCAALPEGLIESELFGHEKGAFTGALSRRLGKFELASGGTLLLDEIAEMAVSMQAKLLRVLQEREINKVGGDDPIEVDIRLIATTNRELDKEIKDGRFREDLFYRLNVFCIHLPPLRERREDIGKLSEHFIEKFNRDNGLSVEGLDDGCLKMLESYDWPGNIRELENTLERAVVLTRSGRIAACHLTIPGQGAPRAGGAGTVQAGATIAQVEKDLILRTLEHCGQNRTKAAQMLGISIRTLRNKLNEYGVVKE
jgi:DNA-binding NtrC family response regulator